jgi:soluble lytic murein transglycosylase-like protein
MMANLENGGSRVRQTDPSGVASRGRRFDWIARKRHAEHSEDRILVERTGIRRTGKLSKDKARACGSIGLRRSACLAVLALTVDWSVPGPANAEPAVACEQEMIRAARTYDVPLAVLYAIGMTETGRRGSLHPYALNIEGPSFFPATLSEATSRLRAARSRGAKLIDVGCMQINYHYHGSRFRSPEAMFDPHANVSYAAQFLKQLRAREGSWTLAAARYHAGPTNNPAQKRYVCQVITNMVASGLGSWTTHARAFCR